MVSQRRINNTYAGQVLETTREEEFAAFDALPLELRRNLNEQATKLSSVSVVRFIKSYLQQGASPGFILNRTLNKLEDLERNEILVFAGRFRALTKTPYPHVQANAHIQRYGEAGDAKHPPRRLAPPRIRGFALNVRRHR